MQLFFAFSSQADDEIGVDLIKYRVLMQRSAFLSFANRLVKAEDLHLLIVSECRQVEATH